MKKLLKILAVIVVVIFAFFAISYLVLNEKMPEATPSQAANDLATEMLEAINFEAWESTNEISWTFPGGHHYQWNRAEDLVTVQWETHEVIINTKMQSGIVTNGENYSYEEVQTLIKTAIDFFNNDSFWLCAPYKVFDPGTSRSIVKLSDDREGLMVTYSSGGTTPGDSYVWILDENHKPTAVKMWVQILPIGGIEFSWENYLTLPSGAMVAQEHKTLGSMNILLEGVK